MSGLQLGQKGRKKTGVQERQKGTERSCLQKSQKDFFFFAVDSKNIERSCLLESQIVEKDMIYSRFKKVGNGMVLQNRP